MSVFLHYLLGQLCFIIRYFQSMAKKTKISEVKKFVAKPKKSRPGVHAKTKTSKNKGSQNYQKPYNKQGK